MARHKELAGGHMIVAAILVTIIMVGIYFVTQMSLKVISQLPVHYYHSLPSSNKTDFDRDGIPDYIDDSDGDGIADLHDATPYGANIDDMQQPSKVFNERLRKQGLFH